MRPEMDRGLVGGEGRSYRRVSESWVRWLRMDDALKEAVESSKSSGGGIGRVLGLCIRYEDPDMAETWRDRCAVKSLQSSKYA
jgi:hypothetical protein